MFYKRYYFGKNSVYNNFYDEDSATNRKTVNNNNYNDVSISNYVKM